MERSQRIIASQTVKRAWRRATTFPLPSPSSATASIRTASIIISQGVGTLAQPPRSDLARHEVMLAIRRAQALHVQEDSTSERAPRVAQGFCALPCATYSSSTFAVKSARRPSVTRRRRDKSTRHPPGIGPRACALRSFDDAARRGSGPRPRETPASGIALRTSRAYRRLILSHFRGHPE